MSTIVKVFDNYYFSPLSLEKFIEIFHNNGVFEIINDKTYTKRDLEDFISDISNSTFKLGELPYKFYIIENYQDPGKPMQSIKVFKMHHVITDGLGIFLTLGLFFSDVYEKDAFI